MATLMLKILQAARQAKKIALNKRRTRDYANADYARAGGVVDPLTR